MFHVLKTINPPFPHSVFSYRTFKEVSKLKMKLLEWALIQPNRYPYKKRRVGQVEKHQGCACAEYKGHARSQQDKDRGFRRNGTCQYLDLGLLASRTMRKYISVV